MLPVLNGFKKGEIEEVKAEIKDKSLDFESL
jgi:hypothetical protein